MQSEFSLALGGGAARGLAHIGVIQRLEELGKTPREISGTSIGAVIGAFYAAGYTSTDMKKIVLDTKILKLIDFDLKDGFFKGNKIVKYLEKYLGAIEFSDLIIPLSIVATDIDTGEKVIFHEGKVIDAIRASISLPGIFRPYKYIGKNLIDGGVMENLPISVLSQDFSIIAVSVRMDFSKKSIKKIESIIPSGISNSYTILRKTLGIIMVNNENASLKEHPNTFLIYPSREDIDFYDFGKMPEMIEEGYRASESLVSYFSY